MRVLRARVVECCPRRLDLTSLERRVSHGVEALRNGGTALAMRYSEKFLRLHDAQPVSQAMSALSTRSPPRYPPRTLAVFIAASLLQTACVAKSEGEQSIGGVSAAETFQDARVASLASAACAGNKSAVAQTIADGADPNARGREGVTVLLWAERCGNVDGMEALLQAGASPNLLTSPNGVGPVTVAATLEDSRILKVLLKHGGDPNAVSPNSPWTALRLAFSLGVDSGNWTNYELLLEGGADINRVYEEQTIAEFAAALRRYDKVVDLLRRGYTGRLEMVADFARTEDRDAIVDDQIVYLDEVLRYVSEHNVRVR